MNFPAAFLKRPDSHKLRYAIRHSRKSIALRAACVLSATVAPELAILVGLWLLRAASAAAVRCASEILLHLRTHSFRTSCWVACYLLLAEITAEEGVLLPGPRLLLFSGRFQKPFYGPPKQAMVSEVEIEGDLEDDDELVADGGDQPATSLDEVLQMEAEGLAQELEEAAECGLDSDTLQQVEESVEGAAEALLTMREAKVKLQEVKKDRGYGRATPADQKGKMNPKKQSSKHPCFDCGLPGHWAGDPECSKPGQGLRRKNKPVKQVKVTEAMNVEVGPPAADPGNEVLMAGTEGHEVLVTGTFPMSNEFLAAFEQSHLHPQEVNVAGKLAADKMLVGVEPRRWKKLGVDGVLELQLNPVQWLSKKLSLCTASMKSRPHDHLLTESSVQFGLFKDKPSDMAVQRQEMRMMMEQMHQEMVRLRAQVENSGMEVDTEPSLVPDSPDSGSPVNFTEEEIRELNGQAYDDLYGSSRDLSDANEFRIHQDVKKGQAQMIAQAWLQHEQDRKKVSQAPKRMREMMICAHEQEMLDFMTEEIFVQPFDLSLPYDKVSDGFEALQNEHVPRNVLLTKNGKPPDKNVGDEEDGAGDGLLALGEEVISEDEELDGLPEALPPVPEDPQEGDVLICPLCNLESWFKLLNKRAGTGSILARQIAQAREASEELGGVKRPAEVGTEELADEARSRPSAPSAAHESMTVACEKSEACEKAGEDLMKQFNDPTEHPLRVITVMLASAAHKELFWKNMTPEEKKAFHIAAKDAWQVWEDNQAVEVLSIPESEAIRSRTTYARYDLDSGISCWRVLEDRVKMSDLSNKQA
ncbi:Copia protein, partial [Durusdinium trenchii]